MEAETSAVVDVSIHTPGGVIEVPIPLGVILRLRFKQCNSKPVKEKTNVIIILRSRLREKQPHMNREEHSRIVHPTVVIGLHKAEHFQLILSI